MKKVFLALAVVGLIAFTATSCGEEKKAADTEHAHGDHAGHDHGDGEHDHAH